MGRRIRTRPGLHTTLGDQTIGSKPCPWYQANARALEGQTVEILWAQGGTPPVACIGFVQRSVLILVLPLCVFFSSLGLTLRVRQRHTPPAGCPVLVSLSILEPSPLVEALSRTPRKFPLRLMPSSLMQMLASQAQVGCIVERSPSQCESCPTLGVRDQTIRTPRVFAPNSS